MRITREHYLDFVGTLKSEIAATESRMDLVDRVEGQEWEFDAYYEYQCLEKTCTWMETILFVFKDTDTWAEFEDLDALKQYVSATEDAYKAMDAYTRTVLPVDGKPLVGVTGKEWDRIETMRYELRRKTIAWSAFVEFCEYGTIQ